VSTPQTVALADARKGVGMFRLPSVNVPVLGIVENMAWFTPEELPENKYYIFGKGGARALAEELQVPFLGEVPAGAEHPRSGRCGPPRRVARKYAFGQGFQRPLHRIAAAPHPTDPAFGSETRGQR
jgi:ATP-binding protein involved in chromosome partitioning